MLSLEVTERHFRGNSLGQWKNGSTDVDYVGLLFLILKKHLPQSMNKKHGGTMTHKENQSCAGPSIRTCLQGRLGIRHSQKGMIQKVVQPVTSACD